MSTCYIDTKALIAATPATVALVRRELDKSREAQRGGCGTPKAVKVDCAMVERLCRIAEKQADRLAALEAELARLQEDKARLEQVQSDVLANLDAAPDDMDVISAAHFVAGSLSTAEEALEAAQAEVRELRAELARVRELPAKWRAAPQNPDEPLLAMAADELEAAISQPAELDLSGAIRVMDKMANSLAGGDV